MEGDSQASAITLSVPSSAFCALDALDAVLHAHESRLGSSLRAAAAAQPHFRNSLGATVQLRHPHVLRVGPAHLDGGAWASRTWACALSPSPRSLSVLSLNESRRVMASRAAHVASNLARLTELGESTASWDGASAFGFRKFGRPLRQEQAWIISKRGTAVILRKERGEW